mgnify:CR=1 FL=1
MLENSIPAQEYHVFNVGLGNQKTVKETATVLASLKTLLETGHPMVGAGD